MPRIVIAGNGYVGTVTANLFHKAGWEVEGWTYSARERHPDSYPVRALDIADRTAVEKASGSFDAIILCASTHGGGSESYRRVYLHGARNLIEIPRARRFLFTSSTSVYAQTGGEWVDEESEANPIHETGRILRETEEFVIQNGGTVVRLAGIYGPGRSALLSKFLSGEARIEGEGNRYLNQTHRDDIATALFFLMTLPNEQRTTLAGTNPDIFNIVDDQPMTQRACYEWLATRLSRPVPPTVDTPLRRKRGMSNKRVSNRKLRALGWHLRFPNFQDGMEHSVLPAAQL